MKNVIFITLVVLMNYQSFTQNRAINWAFGDSAGLNFLTDPPTPFNTNIITHEPSATISDEEGNLMFYTNGYTVWQADSELMLNGNFLDIIGPPTSTVTQGVIIVPNPGDTNDYYIFHIDYEFIKYTKVDMSYEDGNGLVYSKNNELIFLPNKTEKMQVVRHGNGRDWWLVIQAFPEIGTFGNPFLFYLFLITLEGIAEPIVIEGAVYENQGVTVSIGQMKFNQDGTMLASTNGRSVIIYNFDRCSGLLSYHDNIDSIFIGDTGDRVYGIEFSPDGSKLYISKAGEFGDGYIYQYCIECDIKPEETKTVIYKEMSTGESDKTIGQLQMAINDKIYVSMVGPSYPTNLSVINDPNELGLACNFDTLSISTGDKIVRISLPNMPNYNLGVLPKSACDTLSTSMTNISNPFGFKLYPNPASGYLVISRNAQANGNHVSIFTVRIYDAFNREVFLKHNYTTGNTLHLPPLSRGLYMVQVWQDNNLVHAEKIVITQEY